MKITLVITGQCSLGKGKLRQGSSHKDSRWLSTDRSIRKLSKKRTRRKRRHRLWLQMKEKIRKRCK